MAKSKKKLKYQKSNNIIMRDMETNSATLNTVCSIVNTDYFLKNYKNPLNPEWIKKAQH
jgi:hypothetical protein